MNLRHLKQSLLDWQNKPAPLPMKLERRALYFGGELVIDRKPVIFRGTRMFAEDRFLEGRSLRASF